MSVRKTATIIANLVGGFIVISVALSTLPIHLWLPWVIFNLYLWVVAPISLLWANKKEGVEEHGHDRKTNA